MHQQSSPQVRGHLPHLMERKPLKLDLAPADAILLTDMLHVFLILLSNAGLASVSIDECCHMNMTVSFGNACKVTLQGSVVGIIRMLQAGNRLERIWRLTEEEWYGASKLRE